MAGLQAAQEPIFAGPCQFLACLLHDCICLDQVVPHPDTWLRRYDSLDGSFVAYKQTHPVVEVSPLREMVLGRELVVQRRSPSEAMRALRLAQI
jgi:hypothetical protein